MGVLLVERDSDSWIAEPDDVLMSAGSVMLIALELVRLNDSLRTGDIEGELTMGLLVALFVLMVSALRVT